MNSSATLHKLKSIRQTFAITSDQLSNTISEHLTTYLSGGFNDVNDEHLVNTVLNLSSWLSNMKLNHHHTHTIAFLLLMDQWGADIERIQKHLNLDSSEMQTMSDRLVEQKLLQDGVLIHPWYDHVGSDLKKQILIYAAVMLGMLNIQEKISKD